MKTILTLFLLLSVAAFGQKSPEVPRLSGIVDLPEFKKAVFEWKADCCGPRQLVLTEGESMWGVELLSIASAQRSVQVNVKGAQGPITLILPARSNSAPASGSGIEIVDASVYSVLDLYGQLTGKTLLYWPRLPTAGVSAGGSAASRKDAAKILQTALDDRQIASVTDGEKFIMIVPADQVSAVKPRAPRSESASSPKTAAELLPPDSIIFKGVTIDMVYPLYAEYIQAKLDRSGPLPTPIQPFIFLYTRSALSRDEVVYALDTIFGWQGIKMVRGQNGSVRPVQEKEK